MRALLPAVLAVLLLAAPAHASIVYARGNANPSVRIAGDGAFKEAAPIHQFQAAQKFSRQVMGFGALRAGYQHAGESAFGAGMRAQERKGVGMTALQQDFDGLPGGLHSMPHISLAYSRMVRSDENHPTCATLFTAAARQFALSFQR